MFLPRAACCCYLLVLSIGNIAANVIAPPVSINLQLINCICTERYIDFTSVFFLKKKTFDKHCESVTGICNTLLFKRKTAGTIFCWVSREILRVPLLALQSSPNVLSRKRIMSCFRRIWIGDANNYSDRIWGPDLKVRFIPLQQLHSSCYVKYTQKIRKTCSYKETFFPLSSALPPSLLGENQKWPKQKEAGKKMNTYHGPQDTFIPPQTLSLDKGIQQLDLPYDLYY